MMSKQILGFRLGLIVNPFAGVGGPVANKGSDDSRIQALAYQGALRCPAPSRAQTFMDSLQSNVPKDKDITVVTIQGAMGSDYVNTQYFGVKLLDFCPSDPTSSVDTEEGVRQICASGVDLLVFVGGDGTARDVCRVISPKQVALGVPAGVKMHSGVYAISPKMAAHVVALILSGEILNLAAQEVRDIDEQSFREGVVKSKYFGELWVPEDVRFLQNVKQGGLPQQESELFDIAEQLQSLLPENCLVVIGPGSTTFTVLKNWRLSGTLLGVDLVKDGKLLAADVTEQDILQALDQHSGPSALVITAIGGQGHILGRGNQQISPKILRRIGRDNVHVVATKTKLNTLAGRPFIVDSGDEQLDEQWSGYMPVITGFNDLVLYPVGYSV